MSNPIVDFFKNQKQAGDYKEAKLTHLRKLKLTELEYIAKEYGILPDEVLLQTNPRRAWGWAIADSLDLEVIKNAVRELK